VRTYRAHVNAPTTTTTRFNDLYGRARTLLSLEPLSPAWLAKAFPGLSGFDRLVAWTAWGGVPRYWELAAGLKGSMESRVVSLVLDPMGPLHLEPDRLLLEETPSAADLRPLLDAIGAGAQRVSEIAGRIGRPERTDGVKRLAATERGGENEPHQPATRSTAAMEASHGEHRHRHGGRGGAGATDSDRARAIQGGAGGSREGEGVDGGLDRE
jgi:hypothetical protein